MSRKDALDCWVNTCPPHTVWWEKDGYVGSSNTTYKGECGNCGVEYSIGTTIGGGMVASHEDYAKIEELNK